MGARLDVPRVWHQRHLVKDAGEDGEVEHGRVDIVHLPVFGQGAVLRSSGQHFSGFLLNSSGWMKGAAVSFVLKTGDFGIVWRKFLLISSKYSHCQKYNP